MDRWVEVSIKIRRCIKYLMPRDVCQIKMGVRLQFVIDRYSEVTVI